MIFRAEIQNENEGGGNGTQQAAAAAVFFFLKTATEGTFSKYIVKVRFHVFPAWALYDWMEAISLLICKIFTMTQYFVNT